MSHVPRTELLTRCLKGDGSASNGNNAALMMYVRFRTCSCVSGELTKELFSQQTGLALHAEPEPTPMAVMGEQLRPRRTSKSERTMPNSPRRAVPAAELAYDASVWLSATSQEQQLTTSVFSQHWREPVLHWLAVVTVGAGAVTVRVVVVGGGEPQRLAFSGLGVATARRVSAKTERAEMRENMLAVD